MIAEDALKPYSRELARWCKLKYHQVQHDLVNDIVRFKVVPAGRRSGKTERAKRFVVREAMREPGSYFVAAPTRDQVKRIYWNDLKRLSFCSSLPEKPSETELTIRYPNGSTLSLIGLDQPQRMEGSFWSGGIIDEIADVKEGAWEENISPALDTFNPSKPEYRAWCWLIGVPDGMNHYYDMAQRALSGDPDWKLYTWPSSDILPPDVIEAAKRRMSLRQFRQEYEASFETSTGRIYEDYSKANHTDARIERHERLRWMHDFNYTPLSSAIGVIRNNADIYLLDEIVLTSAVAQQSAQEFVDKFKTHENKHVIIYGDPSGRAGEKHGHESDYIAIERVLRDNGWSFERRVQNSTRSIKDGQNAVRAKIANANGDVSLFVNPHTAPYVHKALATGTLKKGSTFLEEDGEYQHIGTAVRYFVDTDYPIGGGMAQIQIAGR